MQSAHREPTEQDGESVQRKRRKREESSIQAKILEALGLEADLRLFRNNVGVATFHGAKVRYGLLPGSGDLIGILHPGRFISLEVKSATGTEADAQQKWRRMVQRMGGFACVVRSVEEARAAIDRARAGATE